MIAVAKASTVSRTYRHTSITGKSIRTFAPACINTTAVALSRTVRKLTNKFCSLCRSALLSFSFSVLKMRENPSKPNSEEKLNGFQTPYNDINHQKQMLYSVSSNVYYGYQPLTTTVQNTAEPMLTEDLHKPNDEMDTTPLENRFINRKRTRSPMSYADQTWDNCKKRRQNEPQRPSNVPQRYSPSKLGLDEDLLRETHGCSYYHWVANNI